MPKMVTRYRFQYMTRIFPKKTKNSGTLFSGIPPNVASVYEKRLSAGPMGCDKNIKLK
jgi:hypothetical protein